MVDFEQFREAMANLASSVMAITVSDSTGNPRGLVATAVCSYTASPPTMLISISHESRSFSSIAEASRLGIHLLDDHQDNIAKTLAGKSDDKFADLDWSWRDGVPIIKGSLIAMSGSVASSFAYLDHTIFFVRLDHMEIARERSPLLYFKREMRPVQPNALSA